MLDSDAIRSTLPHRYPMLLVDQVLEILPRKRCVGVKTVTANERLVRGPGGRHYFPPTLIIEAMAQVGGLPMCTPETPTAVMVCVEGFEFDGLAVPGDVIRIEGEVEWFRGKLFKVVLEACTSSGFQARGSIIYACQDLGPNNAG